MARIAGVDIPKNKSGEISLTYIYGIGRSSAQKILEKAGVDWNKKVQDWTDDEQNNIRTIINNEFKVEGALRSEIQIEHQTFDGHWHLPWYPASSWFAVTRTKHQE